MWIQGYLEIDHQSMTDDEFEAFNAMMNQYTLQYYLIDGPPREYYMCILRDDSKVVDLLELMASRNPVINGMWDIDSIPYGKTVSYLEGGEVTIVGEAKYTFDLALHLTHTPKDISVDEEGNATETKVTEFRPLHGFAGWAAPTKY